MGQPSRPRRNSVCGPALLHHEPSLRQVSVGFDARFREDWEDVSSKARLRSASRLEPSAPASFQPAGGKGISGLKPCVDGRNPSLCIGGRVYCNAQQEFSKAAVPGACDGGHAGNDERVDSVIADPAIVVGRKAELLLCQACVDAGNHHIAPCCLSKFWTRRARR